MQGGSQKTVIDSNVDMKLILWIGRKEESPMIVVTMSNQGRQSKKELKQSIWRFNNSVVVASLQ